MVDKNEIRMRVAMLLGSVIVDDPSATGIAVLVLRDDEGPGGTGEFMYRAREPQNRATIESIIGALEGAAAQLRRIVEPQPTHMDPGTIQ